MINKILISDDERPETSRDHLEWSAEVERGRTDNTYRVQSFIAIVYRVRDLTIGQWLKGGLFIYSHCCWSVLWSCCTSVELFSDGEICANIVTWLLINDIAEGMSGVISLRCAIRSCMLFEEAPLVLRNHRLVLLALVDRHPLLLLLLLICLTHFFLSLASLFLSFNYNSKSI